MSMLLFIPLYASLCAFQLHLAILMDASSPSWPNLLFFPFILVFYFTIIFPFLSHFQDSFLPSSPSKVHFLSMRRMIISVLAGIFSLPFLYSYMTSSTPSFLPWVILYLPLCLLSGLLAFITFPALFARFLSDKWNEEFNLRALPTYESAPSQFRLPLGPTV